MEQQVFHENDIDKLKKIVSRINYQNIFLVRDKVSYNISGAKDFISKLIDKEKHLTAFDDFTTNPKLSDLKNGVALYRKGIFDLIIAIGGGTTLDIAKLISIFSHEDKFSEDLVTGERPLKNKKTSVIAIPTTAGSGAEATQFAVLYIGKTKYSVEHPFLLPDYIYLSSEFTKSVSPYIKACSGIDAFCQAVESIWSIHSNKESEEYAIKAVQLVWNNLHKACSTNDETARGKMQEAAHLAGKAINITKTTAPHALSYAFTSYYHIPHGHAVALSLPFFLTHNYHVTQEDCNDSRGPEAVRGRIDHVLSSIGLSIDDAPDSIIHFFNSVNIIIKLNTLIDEFDASQISHNVNIQRLDNNPRKITTHVIDTFLKKS